MKRWVPIKMVVAAVVVAGVILLPVAAGASNSANYRIEEDAIGGAGGADAASDNYRLHESVGASASGESASGQYNQQAGAATTDDPTLSFIVHTPNVDLGLLSASATKTGTATFSVLNYTSYGYVVQTVGHPLVNAGHALAGVNPPVAPQPGTEQFGINLADNTSPDIGVTPQQVPNNSFSIGAAASGYGTPNVFKYVPGDSIAAAPASSGRTDYTISYIANMSITSPGGSYSGNHTLVVVGTY